jgi:ADP-heptose:LPS heptosyltransferase
MFREECHSIDETAALICNLDLVITVDTMTAHLGGALGAPTWTLLAHPPESRWMIEGDRSPWYPTMRLFRQIRPGDWRGVMQRVRVALEREAFLAVSRTGTARA